MAPWFLFPLDPSPPSFIHAMMKAARIVLFLSLFLCGPGFFGGFLGATTYGPITVQEIPMAGNASERSSHGYVEYRFRIVNRDTKAHRVRLDMPLNSSGYSSTNLQSTTNSAEVPPQSTVILRLLQPPVAMEGNNEVRVVIDGRAEQATTTFLRITGHFSGYSSRGNEVAHVLVSQRVPSGIRDFFKDGVPKENEKLEGEVTTTTPAVPAHGHYSTYASTPVDPQVIPSEATVPMEEWSDNWLAYTRFDGVVMTVTDWKEIRDNYPAVYGAVQKYVEAGGMLAILGSDWTPPAEWTLEPGGKRCGAFMGSVILMADDVEAVKPDIAPFRELALQQMRPWRAAMGDPGRYYGRYGRSTGGSEVMSSDTPLLNSMPVVANYDVNVKLIMVLIVAFAVLIGPVNIYVLSIIKRRIWLLWTVPVTSLVASLLVLGVSFLQEGLIRQSSSETYTVLDQRREEAITFGFVGFYSTLTPRGILFSPNTEATACMDRNSYGGGRSLQLHGDGNGNQLFTNGWISARVPSYFAVRKAESQRKERIIFDFSGDKPTAVNALGVPVKSLQLRTPDGS